MYGETGGNPLTILQFEKSHNVIHCIFIITREKSIVQNDFNGKIIKWMEKIKNKFY